MISERNCIMQYLPHCLSHTNASGSCCLGTYSIREGYRTENHLYLQSTLRVKGFYVCMYMDVCMRMWMMPLTMHFVALNEIFVIFQARGRIRNVCLDILIQVPAEVLI